MNAINTSCSVRSKHYLLDTMGITEWLPRRKSSTLISKNPLFCATCLVLLPEKPAEKGTEQHQILTGMLKVLELNNQKLAVAWLGEDQSTVNHRQLIIAALNQWAPYTVLAMGEVLKNILISASIEFDECRTHFQTLTGLEALVQVTYHPAELQKNPDNKKKSYRDLLALKEQLGVERQS